MKGWCCNRDWILHLQWWLSNQAMGFQQELKLLPCWKQLIRVSSCRHSFRSQMSTLKNGTLVLFEIKEQRQDISLSSSIGHLHRYGACALTLVPWVLSQNCPGVERYPGAEAARCELLPLGWAGAFPDSLQRARQLFRGIILTSCISVMTTELFLPAHRPWVQGTNWFCHTVSHRSPLSCCTASAGSLLVKPLAIQLSTRARAARGSRLLLFRSEDEVENTCKH